jgi:ABC-type lipoprotein release transport system permease subunit
MRDGLAQGSRGSAGRAWRRIGSSFRANSLVLTAGMLALASLVASFVPARRAASVNPLDALRAE